MWFEGSIREAIKKAKDEQKIFMVYIEGNDKVSKEMNAVLDSLSDDVVQIVKNEMVSIKIQAESENSKQFSAIYPIVVIPSTYFIGNNGVPLEIIGGAVGMSDFVSKINNVLNMQNPNRQNIRSHQTGSNQSEPNAGADGGSQSSEATNVPLEEKVKRAQMLVEEIRAKKEREEREKEKERERERIKMGKELQKTKKLKEDLEMQEMLKEREKDRREEKMARERVLAQIQADKEERRLRFLQSQAAGSKTDDSPACQWRPKSTGRTARLQLKFPDGNSHVATFESDVPLETVKQYIISKFGYSRFTLSTPYPKRAFMDNDYRSTLRELSLVPASVLLVVPSSSMSSGPVAPLGWFSQLIGLVFAPVMLIWSFIKTFLYGESTNSPRNNSGTTDNQTGAVPKTENQKKPPQGNSGPVKREGNIASLKRKDDDENNTWNGNSTQQM